MHDQRFPGFARCTDVDAKALSLPFRCILVPVVIKSSFADGDDFRMLRQANKFGDRRLAHAGCLRMDADRCEDERMRFGKRLNPRKIFEIDADTDRACDLVVAHEVQQL